MDVESISSGERVGPKYVLCEYGVNGPLRNRGVSFLSLKGATVGLSESKKKDLEAKDFHKLFEHNKHNPRWVAVAEKARTYAKDNITGGNEPRPDDVAEALLPILNADTALREHQRKNRAMAKKYKEAFADYIVDQVLIEPTRGK
jgi:hypothetical protein